MMEVLEVEFLSSVFDEFRDMIQIGVLGNE